MLKSSGLMFFSDDNRLVQFIDSYDPPLKGLKEDLNFVSPRIGEVSFCFNLSLVLIIMFLWPGKKEEVPRLPPPQTS